jgi:putative NIF3 family GTP cyclohydrolase 1 type 2
MPDAKPAPAKSHFAPRHTGPTTALQVIQLVLDKVGVGYRPATIDHVSAGDPLTTVTGIVVTPIASLAALRRAADGGHNLVITYDPGFWSTSDNLDGVEGNALFQMKRDLIRERHLVLFNLHDHWRDRAPDGLTEGMAQVLGWTMPKDGAVFEIAPTTLLALVRMLADRFGDPTIRVVGDPALPVARVAMALGNAAQMPTIALLNGPADVVLAGYCREWEAVEYVQDMIASGSKKALILLGVVVSATPGMQACAQWLKTIITDIPVAYVEQASGFWSHHR